MPYTWIFGHCSLKSPVGKGVVANQLCQAVPARKQFLQSSQLLSIWVEKNLVSSFSHLIQERTKQKSHYYIAIFNRNKWCDWRSGVTAVFHWYCWEKASSVLTIVITIAWQLQLSYPLKVERGNAMRQPNRSTLPKRARPVLYSCQQSLITSLFLPTSVLFRPLCGLS